MPASPLGSLDAETRPSSLARRQSVQELLRRVDDRRRADPCGGEAVKAALRASAGGDATKSFGDSRLPLGYPAFVALWAVSLARSVEGLGRKSVALPKGAHRVPHYLARAVRRRSSKSPAPLDQHDSFAERAGRRVVGDASRRPLVARDLLRAVARAWASVWDSCASPFAGLARFSARGAAYLARSLLGVSFPEAVDLVGHTNHTTAISGYRRVRDPLTGDEDLDRRLSWTQQVLQSSFDFFAPAELRVSTAVHHPRRLGYQGPGFPPRRSCWHRDSSPMCSCRPSPSSGAVMRPRWLVRRWPFIPRGPFQGQGDQGGPGNPSGQRVGLAAPLPSLGLTAGRGSSPWRTASMPPWAHRGPLLT